MIVGSRHLLLDIAIPLTTQMRGCPIGWQYAVAFRMLYWFDGKIFKGVHGGLAERATTGELSSYWASRSRATKALTKAHSRSVRANVLVQQHN